MNTLIVAAIRCFLILLLSALAYADSAQWNLDPTSGDWNTAANWTPMTVPNGPADIATFALSNITDVSISEDTEVNGITFTSAATNPYFIEVSSGLTLTISGTGITNNSGIAQVLYCDSPRYDGGQILFSNSASAGNSGITSYGLLQFSNNSTAGSSSIINGGEMDFFNTSTAGGANIINLSTSVSTFWDNSSAGSATIAGYDVSYMQFLSNSTAGNATIGSLGDVVFSESSNAGSATISNGAVIGFPGAISFYGSSQGGTARIELLFNPQWYTFGLLDISSHDAPGVTIGSIEGDGYVFLGENNLTVGSNSLSTTFSGVIQDGGFSGSLTKIGTGTFALTGANTYTGDTNINGGVLQLDGSILSNTLVTRGSALAGSGTVNGNVTNYNGTVSPGDALGEPAVLTVGENYTQSHRGTLVIQIGGAGAGQVSVLDVRGNANLNGYLNPVLMNGFVPKMGQSFTILNYTSNTGSFSYIQNQVFDHGRKRWLLVYLPTSARLIAVGNGR